MVHAQPRPYHRTSPSPPLQKYTSYQYRDAFQSCPSAIAPFDVVISAGSSTSYDEKSLESRARENEKPAVVSSAQDAAGEGAAVSHLVYPRPTRAGFAMKGSRSQRCNVLSCQAWDRQPQVWLAERYRRSGSALELACLDRGQDRVRAALGIVAVGRSSSS